MTPDSSRFWPTDGYEPGKGQPSFDKQFVRDWASRSGWDKSPPAPEIPDDVVERTRALYVEAYERIAGEPFERWLERAGAVRVRVLIRPKEGILDPVGQTVEGALPALGFDGVSNVHVGRMVELDVEDESQVPAMCERLLANPLIEDYEVADARGVKFGVVRFPGSCDEVDALLACRRFGDAELLWHKDRDLGGVDAVVVPGGFSYGDYLRAGAIARFSPLMETVIEFAREGGPVLGICNGFQVLCEAGLLPGALLPNRSLRFVCRQVDVVVENADTPFTRACARDEVLSVPVKHTTGPLPRAGDPGGAGRAALRAGPQPERRAGRHRGRVQRRGQRARADAAPRARGRPADRVRRRRPAVRVARPWRPRSA